jgi:hypothetical protein
MSADNPIPDIATITSENASSFPIAVERAIPPSATE